MSDAPTPKDKHSEDSYDPHRSSIRLKASINLEMLSHFLPYLRSVAAREWRRSLEAKESVSDLVQEAFTAGVRDFTSFEGKTEGELAAWLRRILLRVMHTKLRKYKSQRADIDKEIARGGAEFSGKDPTPSEIVNQLEQRLRLETALQELPEKYRRVIELHHIDGLTFQEIGTQIDKSAEAVRKLWVRGLVSLQQRLGDGTSLR